MLLTSGPWLVPATPISHRRLPPALEGGGAANSAALFRARLRREWAAAGGAWQAQATLIIDGHWGERLRRTSWQRVTRGPGVVLWPGPQSRPAAEWRAEEKEQKAGGFAVNGALGTKHWATQLEIFREMNPTEQPALTPAGARGDLKPSYEDMIEPRYLKLALEQLGNHPASFDLPPPCE